MSTFEYFNPNPTGTNTRDCVIRAMCAVLDIDWDTAFDMIAERAKAMGQTMDDNAVYGSILRQYGFYKAVVPNWCPDCYTAEDFARDHPVGTYLLGFDGHVAAVISGRVLDSWDSSGLTVAYYWGEQED